MGATNEIKGTNITFKLVDKECPQCQQKFTQQEIDDGNFDLWWDTSNDVKLTPMEELKEDAYYKPFGRTGYELTIWIRSIEHQICPNTKLCNRCDERLITNKTKEHQGEYYCFPCYQQITNQGYE